MRIKSLLNIASSIYYITTPVCKKLSSTLINSANQVLTQNKYVSGEEFEVLRDSVSKLHQKQDIKFKK